MHSEIPAQGNNAGVASQLLIVKMPHWVAMASHIPSTHKGHGFRYEQADNKCDLRAGAATCIEFKVNFDLSQSSEFFSKLPIATW